MVLKWITGSKVDHPLADPKEAKALIAELPTTDYLKALEEITRWLESLAEAEGFKLDRLFEITELLDTTAQPHHRRLVNDYLTMSRQQKFHENKLWTTGYNYSKWLGEVYYQCVKQYRANAGGASAIKKSIPLIVARAMRAFAVQVKWTMLRYGPFEPRLWSALGELYRYAEKEGFAGTTLTIYPGARGTGTPAQEYLKVMMLWASSADVLAPIKQEIAERLVAYLAPDFRIGNAHFPGAMYAFNAAGERPPQRIFADVPQDPNIMFFGAGDAPKKIARITQAVETGGAVPSDVNLGATYTAEMMLPVLKHLALYWSDKPPSRASERRATTARITIVPGYHALVDELERDETDALNFSVSNAESWVVENVSENGYGALVPASTTDWLRVGEMIGVQVEGTQQWGIGIVRRVRRDEQRQYHVGIEIISRNVVMVRFSYPDSGREPENAVLLSGAPDANGEVGVVLRPGRYDPNATVEVAGRTKSYRFAPSRMIDAGDDFDWAAYTVAQP